MKANRLFLGAALAVAMLSIVPQDAGAQAFDRKGWVQLGEKRVDGKKDRDVIRVGKDLGPMSKIMVVVEDSDLEITRMEIEFGNGEKSTRVMKQLFKEGERTHAIDLPGAKRNIKKIDFHYGNLPGGGKARVLVFGKGDVPGAESVPPPGQPTDGRKARWDRAGWVKLGDKVVNGKNDRDVIPVGRAEGKFTKLMLVVEDSDLELTDLEIVFGNGEKVNPRVKHFFKENDRTRAVDFPGAGRTIKRVDLRYGNLPGGGRARVEIWAREKGGDGGVVPPGPGPGPGPGPVGPLPIVSDFWPRRGGAGAKLFIQGRRFAPGVQVVFGDKVVDPAVKDPFMMSVAVPGGLKGAVPVMLRQGGRRDVPVGFFTIGGKDEDRARARARWRAASEKWWKARERELAKSAAEREAALARAEAELAAARAKRREERLIKLRERWQADLLAREEARIELAVHGERAARLARMLRLAEAGGFGGLAIRIHTLIEIENARHDTRMNDLKLTASR